MVLLINIVHSARLQCETFTCTTLYILFLVICLLCLDDHSLFLLKLKGTWSCILVLLEHFLYTDSGFIYIVLSTYMALFTSFFFWISIIKAPDHLVRSSASVQHSLFRCPSFLFTCTCCMFVDTSWWEVALFPGPFPAFQCSIMKRQWLC